MLKLCGAVAVGISVITAAYADASPNKKRTSPSPSMRVTATAYCQSGRTQSGVRARTGIVAADPRVLPVGSVVRIVNGPTTGIYTVMDTGADIKGRRIDVYIPSCARAKKFGRRTVRVVVMRRGWNPDVTAPQ